mmetsp:Transcript_15280/g.20882  ORF Transcript_15280/g.20882 Transcript_15280/m.20882 type:complete len:81 (-) Transcript_15280:395-637(-)
MAVASTAGKVLQRRAIQCSFSSVFHLKNSGMAYKESKEAEKIFLTAVALPLACMGFAGAATWGYRNFLMPTKKGGGMLTH